jgi:hypothetical protein
MCSLLILQKQAQMKAETNTTFIPIDHQTVPTPKRMQFAAASITIGQKMTRTILSMANLALLT